jgi:Domain of unknown function (DUF4350)
MTTEQVEHSAGVALDPAAPDPAAPDATAPDATALDPSARARLHSLRRPLLVVGLVLLVAAAVTVGRAGNARGYLDPDAATPDGGRALRVLLEERGVNVTAVGSSEAATTSAKTGDTLLVASPNDLSPHQLAVLVRSTADLVLVDPSPPTLARLTPWLSVQTSTETDARDPVCDLAAAVRAGRATTGGLTFEGSAPPGGTLALCYAVDGAATVAQAQLTGGRVVTVLGSGEGLTNALLADQGNASLALGLLGTHTHLVWYVAKNVIDDAQGTQSLGDLLPPWVGLAVLQICVGIVLLALWQGRRFGPVVEEPLPVVVRAAEATEGRARLYRRAGARDRAAANLRAAALARVLPLVGQSRTANPAAVTDVVAARTGRSTVEIGALLYGAAPGDDAALVRLATELDTLERMVRHP